MNIITKKISFGNQTITLETGRIARQATSVFVSMGKTQILVTVVAKKEADPKKDFFALSVDYIEKTYAAGKIPGGFLKREGRPSEKETLTARLIDRPIRPLFADGYMNEVQVVCTVVSADKEVNPDMLAMVGVSAALSISSLPFEGPIGAARVGYQNNQYTLNPTYQDLLNSDLDMVVAGTKDAVLMVESEANQLSEEVMLGAVMFVHQQSQVIIDAIADFAKEVNAPITDWQAPVINTDLYQQLNDNFASALSEAYQVTEKMARYDIVGKIKEQAQTQFATEESDTNSDEVTTLMKKLEKSIVRNRILNGQPRIDGRDTDTVRQLHIETGVLKSTHGSALFTRGETQALVTTTLGTKRDAQLIETLSSNNRIEDYFLMHYNFPPYCVGETGMIGSVKRREIGHGRLARRGISACLPSIQDYPYTIRVVSEITESNGSSSMASVCGASLSLMDAGVPLKSPVAGIAMGLVKDENGDKFQVLTDILGDEDHLGDMDFKVAGTSDGINALQMDIKINGITEEIMKIALQKAQKARLHILGEMNQVIYEANSNNQNAPKSQTVQINKDKIRDLIGKGGETIKGIIAKSGASVDVNDEGLVTVFANNSEDFQTALDMVNTVTEVPEVGNTYKGKIARIVDFGAFVTVLPSQDGLLHISEIAHERVSKVSDHLKEGDTLEVKVIGFDRGKIKLSRKALLDKPIQET